MYFWSAIGVFRRPSTCFDRALSHSASICASDHSINYRSTVGYTVRCCSIPMKAVCCTTLRHSSRPRTTTAFSSPWARISWRWQSSRRLARWARTSSSGRHSDSACRLDSGDRTLGFLPRVKASYARCLGASSVCR